jgi:hypothetical protein
MARIYFTRFVVLQAINNSKPLTFLAKLVEHLQAYHAKWKRNVNEKNSVAQVATKVRALEKKYRNAERSSAAPAIVERDITSKPKHLGRLPETAQPAESQYQLIMFHTGPPNPSVCPPLTFNEALHRPQSNPDTLQYINTEFVPNTTHQMDTSKTTVAGPSSSRKRKRGSSEKLEKARKIRTCRKCGLSGCKGSSRVEYCPKPCRDCAKTECKGRNSKHPEKDCQVGWSFYHSKPKVQ